MLGLGYYFVKIVFYLFKSLDFNVLDKEVFFFRKCTIFKCFIRMVFFMVEIFIKLKGKFFFVIYKRK